MKKLFISVAFAAASAGLSCAAMADSSSTSYTVTGKNEAACQVTNAGTLSTTWTYNNLFQHGAPSIPQSLTDTPIASVTCNAPGTTFSIASTYNGMVNNSTLWAAGADRVNYKAKAKLRTQSTAEIDTSTAVSTPLTASYTLATADGIPHGDNLTLTLNTTASSTMLAPGDYTDVLVFAITPLN